MSNALLHSYTLMLLGSGSYSVGIFLVGLGTSALGDLRAEIHLIHWTKSV